MLTGLYSAATAMQTATRQHEVVAQNLAHAQMPGYRRVTVRHSTFESQFEEELQGAVHRHSMGANAGEVVHDFTQGTVEETEHPYDLALQGEGFFVVQGPQGPLYTRNGSFQLDANGRLVTADHLPVQGTGGDIVISAGDGPVSISQDGAISIGESQVGQLKLVKFQNLSKLQSEGVTLFSAPPDAGLQDAEPVVLQGMQERSNVSPIQELVEMIAAQRRHEAAQKSMGLLNEAVGKRINLNGQS